MLKESRLLSHVKCIYSLKGGNICGTLSSDYLPFRLTLPYRNSLIVESLNGEFAIHLNWKDTSSLIQSKIRSAIKYTLLPLVMLVASYN